MNFAKVAERFQFATGIDAHTAIKIVQAWIETPDNGDDTESTFIVRPVPKHGEDFACDGCGAEPKKFTVEQRHPEGGSFLGECCWLQEEAR